MPREVSGTRVRRSLSATSAIGSFPSRGNDGRIAGGRFVDLVGTIDPQVRAVAMLV